MDSLLCGYLRFGKPLEKQSLLFVVDTDTPTEGIDGHTYLRGELKETNDQSYTRTHKYAIARQE